MILLETLNAHPFAAMGVAFMFALMIGSFLNVVIYRVPKMMELEWQAQFDEMQGKEASQERFNLSVPASSCPKCGHKIRWFENIPVISYLMQKGQCNGCHTPISARYPSVELFTALISMYVVSIYGLNEISLAVMLFSWILICLTLIDYDTQLLPDSMTLPLLWLGLLVNSFGMFTSLHMAVAGAMLGYLSLWSIYWLFKLLTGKEGMGYGDFKLLAALGAWAGADQLPVIILFSSLVGAIFGIMLIVLKRHERQNPIPFGPYLAVAGWISLIWGQEITHKYLQLIGV
ncbi:A24 family peptidase [Pontibacterium sp.]|uniref:prepilin peptidase n=1 Tax=Pontibacterium sp. TaxID=2036026 RepID=UPI00356315E2